MGSEWIEAQLGDICTFQEGYVNPSQEKSEYFDGEIKWIRAVDLNNGFVHNTSRTLTRIGFDSAGKSASFFEPNTIVISKSGTIGRLGIITDFMCGNRATINIKPIKEVSTRFVFYLLRSHQRDFDSLAVGSVQKNLYVSALETLEVMLPDLETQSHIAATLSCLDDKIELNNRIIANLEAQAQAIFKSWFVDFEPWGGEAPADWSITTIDSLCSLVTRGITPKYSDDATQIVINQKCIRNHKIDLGESRSHTPATKNEKWLEYGDIVINSTGQGTLGRVAQVFFSVDNITVDSHVTIVRPKRRNLNSYLGLWTISKEDEIESMASGSTGQTELSRERVKALTLFEPDNSALDTFANIIEPMTEMIQKKQEENASLAQTRDTLLPKLMSGEIEVPVEG